MRSTAINFNGVTLSELTRLGWREKNIKALTDILQPMLGNYARLTGHSVSVQFLFNRPDISTPPAYIEQKSAKIYIYLSLGPKIVLGNAPALIVKGLLPLAKARIRFAAGPLPDLLEKCAVKLVAFYNQNGFEDCPEVNLPQTRKNLDLVATQLMNEALEHKIAAALLGPRMKTFARALVENELDRIEYYLNKYCLRKDEFDTGREFARLAMCSFLSAKFDLGLNLRSYISGRRAGEITLISFAIATAGKAGAYQLDPSASDDRLLI